MPEDMTTFPTLRSWRRMSEREQDVLLDRIESRRRRRSLMARIVPALLAVAAAAAVVVALLALAR
jgi:hypothetical protein